MGVCFPNSQGGFFMAVRKSKVIPRAKFPEQVGISSHEIKSLIDDFDRSGIEVHSMILMRKGKIAFEAYRHPFNPQTPHVMYSVSKSFTAIAIGFAVEEGLLTLDTKVIDLFPEFRPKKYDETLESMTVFHLLTMTAGKDISLLSDKTKDRWVKDFFDAKWAFKPGQSWRYISENTYLCSVIIKKLTGMGLIDYLTPRLFKPLGITRRPFWEVDPQGIEAGGWGLYLTTDELARFMLCISNKGKYAGVQVIPEWYVEEATKKQVKNTVNEDRDSVCGYGYFFWRNAFKNSYRADGMFSQFGIVLEDYDSVLVFTCSEVFEQKTRDCIFRHVPHMFIKPKRFKPNDAYDYDELTISPIKALPAAPRSIVEEFIDGKTIKLNKNPLLNAVGWPLSMLPLAIVYMSANRAGNIDNIVLNFSENECSMTWDEGKEHNTIACGMDGEYRQSRILLGGIEFTAVSSAQWVADDSLQIRMRPLESVAERIITLTFKGSGVTLVPESNPPLQTVASGIRGTVEQFISIEALAQLGGKAVMKLDRVLETPISGKIV